jgi:hypothetical protein
MKRTHSGAPSGKGAVYEWEGDKNVGQGRMEITDTSAPNKIVIKLDFIKPFPSTCDTVFAFHLDGSNTFVSWTMTGKKNFIAKAFHLFEEALFDVQLLDDRLDNPVASRNAREILFKASGRDRRHGIVSEKRVGLERTCPLQSVPCRFRRDIEQHDRQTRVRKMRGDLRAHRAGAKH